MDSSHARPLGLGALTFALVLAVGCPDDGSTPAPDGGVDGSAPADSFGADQQAADTGPGVARPSTPTPVAIDTWMVAMAVSPDPVWAALRDGTFTYPEAR